MARKETYGNCRLCGDYGELSFEHIPPRSAYNHSTVLEIEIKKRIGAGSLDDLGGPQNQKGAGTFSLCIKCNNQMGIWYVPEYSSWAQQGMEFLMSSNGPSRLIHRFLFCPINVFKQIVGMMCCLNSPKFTELNPELRRFVLEPRNRDWNPKYRIYANFNLSTRNRHAGGQGILVGTKAHVVSELTFPRFTYLMTHDCDPPSAELLVYITFFVESLYNEIREVWMNLPVVEQYTWYPADYRSKDEILKQAANR